MPPTFIKTFKYHLFALLFFSFILLLLLLLSSPQALAHVKWFTDFRFEHNPLTVHELLTGLTFWGLFSLSVMTFPLLVYLDRVLDRSRIYRKMNLFFDQFRQQSPLIVRVTMGASLLLSWQSDSMIAPEIAISHPFWGWFQFVLVLLLLTKYTTPLAGIGMLMIYLQGLSTHGVFHLLDYVIYPAVAYFLIVSQSKNIKVKDSGIPILYVGLGFSLCWVALEKMFYPFWGLSILEQMPQLTMGLPADFFLLSAAFVEFALGYLLIICLLSRPLALVITLVFFTTTLFFGKVEVIGHTILHGSLLVFIVNGNRNYFTAPINFHQNLPLRMSFAAVNFILLFFLLFFPYAWMSDQVHQQRIEKYSQTQHSLYEVKSSEWNPQVKLEAHKDSTRGWNVRVKTSDFTFAAEQVNQENRRGFGHAHLYINEKLQERIYGEWSHLVLPPGNHRIRIGLYTNNHKKIAVDGIPVEDAINLFEDREKHKGHAH